MRKWPCSPKSWNLDRHQSNCLWHPTLEGSRRSLKVCLRPPVTVLLQQIPWVSRAGRMLAGTACFSVAMMRFLKTRKRECCCAAKACLDFTASLLFSPKQTQAFLLNQFKGSQIAYIFWYLKMDKTWKRVCVYSLAFLWSVCVFTCFPVVCVCMCVFPCFPVGCVCVPLLSCGVWVYVCVTLLSCGVCVCEWCPCFLASSPGCDCINHHCPPFSSTTDFLYLCIQV